MTSSDISWVSIIPQTLDKSNAVPIFKKQSGILPVVSAESEAYALMNVSVYPFYLPVTLLSRSPCDMVLLLPAKRNVSRSDILSYSDPLL